MYKRTIQRHSSVNQKLTLAVLFIVLAFGFSTLANCQTAREREAVENLRKFSEMAKERGEEPISESHQKLFEDVLLNKRPKFERTGKAEVANEMKGDSASSDDLGFMGRYGVIIGAVLFVIGCLAKHFNKTNAKSTANASQTPKGKGCARKSKPTLYTEDRRRGDEDEDDEMPEFFSLFPEKVRKKMSKERKEKMKRTKKSDDDPYVHK